MHETIETTALADHDHPPVKSGKVCVACGKDVAGQKRFKDAQGRYWCYDCGVDDHVRKHPEEGAACSKCGEKFSPTKLFEFDGGSFCESCLTKAKMTKKREQQRIAAAAEEARRQAQHRKMFVIGAGAAVVAACGFAAWRLLF
jgi:hypothetical protein